MIIFHETTKTLILLTYPLVHFGEADLIVANILIRVCWMKNHIFSRGELFVIPRLEEKRFRKATDRNCRCINKGRHFWDLKKMDRVKKILVFDQ